MGIPQFFRYISQRYPCITREIEKSTIPEFDNLYLDMNGIIHTASHPTDDILVYLSNETILRNIFQYIDQLFRIIQPQKVFFLSVDGVAPRAKINQQRGRRFRAAKLLELQKDIIKSKGLDMPEKVFDSNCITPGTAFMEMCNEGIKRFIAYKISTDRHWQKCKVIYSGSEVPGEGEHKIMDYIRYLKAQPDYDVNTRHCLYGQDADLIMLAISTHELQFTLLREVVTFGKMETKSETKFCLVYISLLREYLDLEFSSLKDSLPFPYDLEKIIDDWVLMGFLIGNDFIPHLPNLLIVKDALELLISTYMKVLPTLQGYMNELGTLRLDRFEKFLECLSQMEMEHFSELLTDLKYFEAKTGRRPDESERHVYKNSDNALQDATASPKKINKDFDALIKSTAMMSIDVSDDDDDDLDTVVMEFVQHKRDYYMNKLKYESVDEECLRSQAEGYVRAIQWNLHYYYNGCVDWSWYYPHHYAPYISDIKGFKDLNLDFELGEPLLPFEQLLAVLPPESKALLPEAFQWLVTESESPIIDYYPTKFETDLNGKRQEWTAVILLPFVDKESLQTAMKPHFPKLTSKERERNKHGPMYIYTYTQQSMGTCELLPYFSDIENHAHVESANHADIIVPREKLVKGLVPGINRDIYHLGFATFRYIQYTASIQKLKVKVFQHPTIHDNMVLTLEPKTVPNLKTVASQLLGQIVYVNWPYLVEAYVESVTDGAKELSLINPKKGYSYENICEETKRSTTARRYEKKQIVETYQNRYGIVIGPPVILVRARPLVGNKYVLAEQEKLYLKKQWASMLQTYAYQTIVKDIMVYSTPIDPCKYITDVFTPGTVCFMLGHPHYGAMGQVQEMKNAKSDRIKVMMSVEQQPVLDSVKKKYENTKVHYMNGYEAAHRLGISIEVLSKITGTLLVVRSTDDDQKGIVKHNIGLKLKCNTRNYEVPGYTRRENGRWLYSAKVVEIISKYMVKNPLVFQHMTCNMDILYEKDIFTDGDENLESLMAWLKEQLQGIESCPIGAESLPSEIVHEIEAILSAHESAQINSKKAVVMHVKPHLLYVPKLQLQTMPDPKAQHQLLDRVCSIGGCTVVPLGYKGIIVGIQNDNEKTNVTYNVLFDKPFFGGVSVNGCTEGRGFRLSFSEFLNISYGERSVQAKTVEMATETEHRNLVKLAKNPQANVNKPFPVLRMPEKTGNGSKTKQEIVSPRTEKETDETAVIATSKFQALWNELHERQKSIKLQKATVHNPTNINMNLANKGNTEIVAQDPSDVLKAILKIPSGNEHTAQSTPREPCKTHTSNSVTKSDKEMDAPPLVKQLFDQARQNEKGKSERSSIWYCLQLLSYYQQNRIGIPRYRYLTDKQTDLIRANILLPDGRIFAGDRSINREQAAESAARKAYTELNLGSMQPHAKTLLPPPMQWHNNTWQQSIRPPVLVGYLPNMQPSQQYSTFNAKLPPKPQFPPPPVHKNQYKPHDEQLPTGPKVQVKKSTEFVPLQAQKRNRNIMAKKEMKVASQHAKDTTTTPVPELKGESTSKKNEIKPPEDTTVKQIPVQCPSEHVKQSQPAQVSQNIRPKRSRVAAKFGIQTQIDESHTNSTVK